MVTRGLDMGFSSNRNGSTSVSCLPLRQYFKPQRREWPKTPKRVAELNRNQWPDSTEMDGRIGPKRAVGVANKVIGTVRHGIKGTPN